MIKSDEVQASKYLQYTWAGWLAIVSATLIIPEIILTVGLKFFAPGLEVLAVPIHTVNLLIGIYVLYMFRQLLHHEFDFQKADLFIIVLIALNVVFFILGLVEFSARLGGWLSGTEFSLSLISLILFVLYSLVYIGFAITLLQMKDNLYGLLKPFAYTAIVSSGCGATVLLAPLGLLISVISLVILGMIFLRVKGEAEIL